MKEKGRTPRKLSSRVQKEEGINPGIALFMFFFSIDVNECFLYSFLINFLFHSAAILSGAKLTSPPLINFTSHLIRIPILFSLRKFDFFTNPVFHFLSLLAIFKSCFHGKIACFCIYFSLRSMAACFCSVLPCIII